MLRRQLAAPVTAWLDERIRATESGDEQSFFLAFGMIPRKTGKALLILSGDDLRSAADFVEGWNPSLWSVDQAARTLLVLHLPAASATKYVATLDRLFAAGEVGELVALYQSLALFPHPEAHRLRAAEGIRSSIRPVFAAVSQHNPYPAAELDEGPFNQMVLKCLFVGLPLDPVVGLDRRANPSLARMLLDYAHERWAAKREVSPELWRPLAKFVDEAVLNDLRRVLRTGSDLERRAAALTLLAAPHPGAARLLEEEAQLAAEVRAGEFDWSSVARLWASAQRG